VTGRAVRWGRRQAIIPLKPCGMFPGLSHFKLLIFFGPSKINSPGRMEYFWRIPFEDVAIRTLLDQ
jgi:hypothetical protein